MSRITHVQIPAGAAGAALTPEQRRFNTLTRQIEQARRTLAAWRDNVSEFQHGYAQMLLPLQESLESARRQWVFALDALLDQSGWTRTERRTLQELVCEVAGELLDADDDDELKALFDKHSDMDFDTEKQLQVQAMKELTEAFTGLDLGDGADIRTDDDLFRRMHEELGAQVAAREAQRAAKAQRRRKTPAQERREAEAALAQQSVREIYRKLVSALHPDREPDAARREAKTELMQKINRAYEADDLLTLLEAQLQIEQIDTRHIAGVGAQRLKHYNKVLAEQLTELRTEIERVEAGFYIQFGLEPHSSVKPHQLGKLLEQQIRLLKAELTGQQRDIRMLTDRAATRRWLKRHRQLQREADYHDFF